MKQFLYVVQVLPAEQAATATFVGHSISVVVSVAVVHSVSLLDPDAPPCALSALSAVVCWNMMVAAAYQAVASVAANAAAA